MKKYLKILKENKKHIILKKEQKNISLIIKKSKTGDDKLEKEFYTIKKLRENSEFLRHKIPNVGIGRSNYKSNNFFHYNQRFISGNSLSRLLKSNLSKKQTQNLNMICEELFEHCINFRTFSGKLPSNQIKKLIMQEYEVLKKKPLLKSICEQKYIYVNNYKLTNLDIKLNKLFSSKKNLLLDEDKSIISSLGHFNFHGENIIIKNKAISKNYNIIDPDSSLKDLDNIFSLCRYFYTLDHDTITSSKYSIKGDILELNKFNNKKYTIKYTWKKKILKNYRKIFDIKKFLKNKDQKIKFRFFNMYVYCLLRGANVNYDDQLNLINNKKYTFRNNSFFLFLKLLLFINEKD